MNEDRKGLFVTALSAVIARGQTDAKEAAREALLYANEAFLAEHREMNLITWGEDKFSVTSPQGVMYAYKPRAGDFRFCGNTRTGCVWIIKVASVAYENCDGRTTYILIGPRGESAESTDVDHLKELASVFERAALEKSRVELAALKQPVLLPKGETETMSKTAPDYDLDAKDKPSMLSRAMSSLIAEAQDGKDRTIASTLAEQTQKPMLLALKKAGVPKPGLLWLERKLRTPFGSAAWSFGLGSVIPFIPKVSSLPRVQALGTELRTQGFHQCFHTVSKLVLDPIGDVLISLLDAEDDTALGKDLAKKAIREIDKLPLPRVNGSAHTSGANRRVPHDGLASEEE